MVCQGEYESRRLRSPFGLLVLVVPAVAVTAAPVPLSEDKTAPPAPPAPAVSQPLVADRPDFTESTQTVAPGRLQLEAGYTFTYDRERGRRRKEHAAPETLLRIGVARGLELRLGWPGYVWSESRQPATAESGRRFTRVEWDQGAADLLLGCKINLHEQRGHLPHLGLLAEISVPSGSEQVGARDVQPQVKLLWAFDLSPRASLAGNVNVAIPADERGRFVQTSASVSLALALTDRLGAFVEYFGFYPDARAEDASHSLNGGFTLLLADDFQVDIRAGVGLNEQADDFFAGAGFAWRI